MITSILPEQCLVLRHDVTFGVEILLVLYRDLYVTAVHAEGRFTLVAGGKATSSLKYTDLAFARALDRLTRI